MVNKRRWRVGARKEKKGEKLHIKSSVVRGPHTPAYRWRISLQRPVVAVAAVSHISTTMDWINERCHQWRRQKVNKRKERWRCAMRRTSKDGNQMHKRKYDLNRAKRERRLSLSLLFSTMLGNKLAKTLSTLRIVNVKTCQTLSQRPRWRVVGVLGLNLWAWL